MLSNKTINTLKELLEIFKKYEVDYYLDMRTLVSIEKKDMEKLTKISLSLLNKNDFIKMHTIVSKLRKYGHKVKVSTFPAYDQIDFATRYDIKSVTINKTLTIIFKYENNNRLYWVYNSKKYSVDKNIFDEGFKTINFYNITCKVPKNIKKYLDSIYDSWDDAFKEKSLKKLRPCTIKDKLDKVIRIGQHEGKRFKYHCNKTQGLLLLKKTIQVLEKHDVAYYLDFGTLIGAMREKGFIDWDDDIDISLLREEDYYKMQVVLRDIRKTGLSAYRATFATSIENRKKKAEKNKDIEVFVDKIDFMNEHNTRIIKVIHRNRFEKFIVKLLNKLGQKRMGGKSLDIFFKYKIDDKLVWMAQNKLHEIDANLLSDELIDIYFYDIKCKIPKNYDEYLTSMYGDWKTPKKDWQYYEEDMVTR